MFQSFDATTTPTQGPPRLAALRAELKRENLDGFLIPRADAHQGEYVAPRDDRLAWLTGFTGSAGFCAALADTAGVFVDGRYRVQVKAQVAADFTPVNWPETKLGDWLAEQFPKGGKIGFDPWLHTAAEVEALTERLKPTQISLVETANLIDRIWPDQPDRPMAPVSKYPTDLAGEGDAVFPSVILGMQGNSNDHVNDDGTWRGNYVPAFLRRYPFVFSKSEDGETFTLCIDEEFEGFNNEGKGERLFDSEGGHTQYLETMLKFIQEYQAQFQRTQIFAQKLSEMGLLEPAQAQFQLDGKQSSLAGFQTVNREKLKGLSAKKLKDLAATDELELCYLHLQSLNNLTPMARRLAALSAA